MTKIVMARYIAKVLFYTEILPGEGNWKVKQLMRQSKNELEDLYDLAFEAALARRNG